MKGSPGSSISRDSHPPKHRYGGRGGRGEEREEKRGEREEGREKRSVIRMFRMLERKDGKLFVCLFFAH